jgi:hypothetical protein
MFMDKCTTLLDYLSLLLALARAAINSRMMAEPMQDDPPLQMADDVQAPEQVSVQAAEPLVDGGPDASSSVAGDGGGEVGDNQGGDPCRVAFRDRAAVERISKFVQSVLANSVLHSSDGTAVDCPRLLALKREFMRELTGIFSDGENIHDLVCTDQLLGLSIHGVFLGHVAFFLDSVDNVIVIYYTVQNSLGRQGEIRFCDVLRSFLECIRLNETQTVIQQRIALFSEMHGYKTRPDEVLEAALASCNPPRGAPLSMTPYSMEMKPPRHNGWHPFLTLIGVTVGLITGEFNRFHASLHSVVELVGTGTPRLTAVQKKKLSVCNKIAMLTCRNLYSLAPKLIESGGRDCRQKDLLDYRRIVNYLNLLDLPKPEQVPPVPEQASPEPEQAPLQQEQASGRGRGGRGRGGRGRGGRGGGGRGHRPFRLGIDVEVLTFIAGLEEIIKKFFEFSKPCQLFLTPGTVWTPKGRENSIYRRNLVRRNALRSQPDSDGDCSSSTADLEQLRDEEDPSHVLNTLCACFEKKMQDLRAVTIKHLDWYIPNAFKLSAVIPSDTAEKFCCIPGTCDKLVKTVGAIGTDKIQAFRCIPVYLLQIIPSHRDFSDICAYLNFFEERHSQCFWYPSGEWTLSMQVEQFNLFLEAGVRPLVMPPTDALMQACLRVLGLLGIQETCPRDEVITRAVRYINDGMLENVGTTGRRRAGRNATTVPRTFQPSLPPGVHNGLPVTNPVSEEAGEARSSRARRTVSDESQVGNRRGAVRSRTSNEVDVSAVLPNDRTSRSRQATNRYRGDGATVQTRVKVGYEIPELAVWREQFIAYRSRVSANESQPLSSTASGGSSMDTCASTLHDARESDPQRDSVCPLPTTTFMCPNPLAVIHPCRVTSSEPEICTLRYDTCLLVEFCSHVSGFENEERHFFSTYIVSSQGMPNLYVEVPLIIPEGQTVTNKRVGMRSHPEVGIILYAVNVTEQRLSTQAVHRHGALRQSSEPSPTLDVEITNSADVLQSVAPRQTVRGGRSARRASNAVSATQDNSVDMPSDSEEENTREGVAEGEMGGRSTNANRIPPEFMPPRVVDSVSPDYFFHRGGNTSYTIAISRLIAQYTHRVPTAGAVSDETSTAVGAEESSVVSVDVQMGSDGEDGFSSSEDASDVNDREYEGGAGDAGQAVGRGISTRRRRRGQIDTVSTSLTLDDVIRLAQDNNWELGNGIIRVFAIYDELTGRTLVLPDRLTSSGLKVLNGFLNHCPRSSWKLWGPYYIQFKNPHELCLLSTRNLLSVLRWVAFEPRLYRVYLPVDDDGQQVRLVCTRLNFETFFENEVRKALGVAVSQTRITYTTLFQLCPLNSSGNGSCQHRSCNFQLSDNDSDLHWSLEDVFHRSQRAPPSNLTNANAVAQGGPGCHFLFSTVAQKKDIYLIGPQTALARLATEQRSDTFPYAFTMVNGVPRIFALSTEVASGVGGDGDVIN